ncbi:MAG: hypothetical protein R3C46_05250 [Hyphomonadaceae bacterium]
MDDQERPKPSWPSWLAGTFAALAWVAVAGKFVELVDFVENLVRYWQDILRDLWGALFRFLRLPYTFTLEQRDTLTVLVACCGMILQPYVFGSKPKPLFKTSLQTQRDTWPDAPLDILRVLCASVLMALFVTPFIDQTYYERDLQFYGIPLGILMAVLAGTVGVVVLWNHRSNPRGLIDSFVARLRRADGRITLKSALARGMKPVIWAFMPLGGVILAVVTWFRLDAKGYWSGFGVEQTVSLALLVCVFVTFVLAVRKSLRPIFRMLVVGIAILVVGASAEQLKQIYERYFLSDAESQSSATIRPSAEAPE